MLYDRQGLGRGLGGVAMAPYRHVVFYEVEMGLMRISL